MSESEMPSNAVGLQRKNNRKLRGGVTGRGFLPGQSGNPSGRRRGSVNLATALARTLTRKDAVAICRKLISLCIAGDVPALRLLFDRLDSQVIEERLFQLEQKLEQKNKSHLKNEKAQLF